jgi:hypothetical protein
MAGGRGTHCKLLKSHLTVQNYFLHLASSEQNLPRVMNQTLAALYFSEFCPAKTNKGSKIG